jgi:hypothetical protein
MFTRIFVFLLLSFAMLVNSSYGLENWQDHGTFYLTGGGVYSYVSYSDNPLSFTTGGKTYTYNPESDYERNNYGMRFGFGNKFIKELPFAYEFDYNQTFKISKKSNDFNYGIATKSLVATLIYTLNPKDRLTVSLSGGAIAMSVIQTIDREKPDLFYRTSTYSTDVDPFVGGAILYQINDKWAIRAVQFYDFSTYNRSLSGRAVTLLMINYYPS